MIAEMDIAYYYIVTITFHQNFMILTPMLFINRFHTSYGWLTFWDWFYGTDIEFQKAPVNRDRHFRIHSTSSARELVPDEKPKSS